MNRRSPENDFDERLHALRMALSTERRRRRAAEEGNELASTELARMAGRLMAAEREGEQLEHRLAAQAELSAPNRQPDVVAPSSRSRPGSSRRAPVSVGIAALGFLAIAGALLGGDDSRSSASSSTERPALESARARAAQGSVATIPARYLDIYQAAGRTYDLDWAVLAAVGMAESDHGRSPAAGVRAGRNARGAIGPAQFLPATWERFGVDADGNGRRSPYEPADAIAAMASYLRAEGAPHDWRGALFAYNPDRSYVERILLRAARIRNQAGR